jgi:N-methylhydantoinase A/oxoprolinase/acetone carboxylase beta subunit
MVAIAIDIGGTFTDIVAWDGVRLHATKLTSSRREPITVVQHGIRAALALANAQPGHVTRFVHGTTVATNAVLARTGARVGLLTTAGFEDVIEIGRQKRSRMYDLMAPPETPVFLAPGRRRTGIPERIAADGSVIKPLDEAAVIAAVRQLIDREQVEAIAVIYLFSFVNPAHERRTRELIRSVMPELPVSLSCEIDPAFREYERSCATALDAYVRPVMTGYVGRLQQGLAELGVRAPVEIMQSRGGIAGAHAILQRPVAALLSGPAAGALGGRVEGARAGYRDVITLDMGGTSTDIGVIRGGLPVATREGRIGGFPLRVQMVDVHTIGAGGGSIARLDEAGALKVGPESAEAEPGPACYGRGGRAPTVTDASLVLGLLNPGNFAGSICLDPALARDALRPLAERMGCDLATAAQGVLTVCNQAMAEAIRLVTVRRGIDPREFALVLLGGAGPVHGGAVALLLGISTVIVPARPGVLAAEGLLYARIEQDAQCGFLRSASAETAGPMHELCTVLERECRAALARSAPCDLPVAVRFAADMRYVGQSYEIEVPLSLDAPDPITTLLAEFHRRYRDLHGHGNLTEAVEFVNLRSVAACQPDAPTTAAPVFAGNSEPHGARPVCFDPRQGFREVPVYSRDDLGAAAVIAGPAIIEQSDTTMIVYPGQTCRVPDCGSLIVRWN